MGFNVGGIPDLIHTGENGYLAAYKDVDDLAKGIEWIFADSSRYDSMSLNARAFVENYCSYSSVAVKHQQILTDLLKEANVK